MRPMDYTLAGQIEDSLAGQTEEGLASETRWIKGLDIINIHKEQSMVAMGHNNQKTLLKLC